MESKQNFYHHLDPQSTKQHERRQSRGRNDELTDKRVTRVYK